MSMDTLPERRRFASVEPIPRAGGIVRLLRAAQGRAYPRLIGSWREKSWFLWEAILPLLGTMSFAFVYRALDAPERFIGYVIMGGATMAIWMNVMWMMASQLWWEKKDGNLELYMTAPCGLLPILLGMSIGGLFMAATRALIVVIVGALVFDVSFAPTQIGLFLLVFVVAAVALYALGTLLASLFLIWGREAEHTSNLFMEPVYLVSGFFFPVRTLGFWTGIGFSFIPLTLALDAMRELLYPDHPALLGAWTELGILTALAAVLIVLARAGLRRMEFLARRAGTLGTRY